MAEGTIKLVHENGKIVGKDPETGETIPVSFEAVSTDELLLDYWVNTPIDATFEQYTSAFESAGHDWDHIPDSEKVKWVYADSPIRSKGMFQAWGFSPDDTRTGLGRFGWHLFEGFAEQNRRVTLGGAKHSGGSQYWVRADEGAGFLTYFQDGNHPDGIDFGWMQIGSDVADAGLWVSDTYVNSRAKRFDLRTSYQYVRDDEAFTGALKDDWSGPKILLGLEKFNVDRVFDGQPKHLFGTSATGLIDDPTASEGSRLVGNVTWTFETRGVMEDIEIMEGTVNLNDSGCRIINCYLGGSGTINIGGTTALCIIDGILNSTNGGITVESGAEQAVINGTRPNVTDNGDRTLINGRGTNDGDPAAGGEWNGYASYAEQMDATIHDTTDDTLYKAVGGSWVQIG